MLSPSAVITTAWVLYFSAILLFILLWKRIGVREAAAYSMLVMCAIYFLPLLADADGVGIVVLGTLKRMLLGITIGICGTIGWILMRVPIGAFIGAALGLVVYQGLALVSYTQWNWLVPVFGAALFGTLFTVSRRVVAASKDQGSE